MSRGGSYALVASCSVLCAAVALSAAGCSLETGEYFGHVPEPDPSHLRWCYDDPQVLDPGVWNTGLEWEIFQNLFEPLVRPDERSRPVPLLAQSWDASADSRAFTFHLRPSARFSSGRPITADDVRYTATRLLHPLTASWVASSLTMIRHAGPYSAGTAKLLLGDAAPFRAGEVVEITEEGFPDPNVRIARAPLVLRAAPDASSAAFASLTSGAALTVIELSQDRRWAYVHHARGEGVFGWVELEQLASPNAERSYQVAALDDLEGARRTGAVPGALLLGLPELLGIRVIDAHTIAFELDQPTPHFALWGAFFFVVPRETISRWPRSWYRPEHIVTSGPYELVEWRPRDRLELRRAETYWGRDKVGVERVTIRALDQDHARACLYAAGGCDLASVIPDSHVALLLGRTAARERAARDLLVEELPLVVFLSLDVRHLPSLHLRRALASATDRSQLDAFLKSGVTPTRHWVPGHPVAELSDAELRACGVDRDHPGLAVPVGEGHCYLPPSFPDFDLERARTELQQAHAELGPHFPEKITISYMLGYTSRRLMAEWLQAEWKRHLGLEVQVEARDTQSFLAHLQGDGLEVALLGYGSDYFHPENFFLPAMRCQATHNFPHLCDAEYDRLLNMAAVEPDLDHRLGLLQRAERRLVDQVPLIPLSLEKNKSLLKPYVRGMGYCFDLRHVWIDPDWRTRP